MTTSRTVALTHARLQELLHYDPETGVFTWKVNRGRNARVGDIAGQLRSDGYIRIKVMGRQYLAHRLAWFYIFNNWPTDQLDHKNRIRSNNWINNLREGSNSNNQMNKGIRSNNKSGYVGVSWHKPTSKWRSQIKFGDKQIHLGCFSSLEEAVDARLAAQNYYFKEFSPTGA